MLDPLLAPPALHAVAVTLLGGATLLTALSLLDLPAPFGWGAASPAPGPEEADAVLASRGAPSDAPTLSGTWIGIQLFGPARHDYFAWTLALTQRGTALYGEVDLRMATPGGLVRTAGRVLVRGTVVGNTVTMTLRTPRAGREPSAPLRFTVGADGHAMVGTAQVTRRAPGYPISLVRR